MSAHSLSAFPRAARLATLFAPLAFAACATVGPDYAPPESAGTAEFANAGRDDFTSTAVEARWWSRFEDPALDDLVRRALAANHDLRVAAARLREARAIYREVSLDRLPAVTTSATALYEQRSETQAPGLARDERDVDTYSLGFDAFWELDFFGRLRRAAEAADADAAAAEAGLRDARVTVIAEVARNYFGWRGAAQRLVVAQRNLENQTKTLELTEVLLDAGRGTELDTARARAQLNATAAVIPLLEIAAKEAEHRLAVLLGERPGALALPAPEALAPLAGSFPIGSPAELLRRRPDIRAAERLLASATARVGVATADLFPRVTLTGFLGFVAGRTGDIGTSGSEAWFAAPTLTWAAFDLGSVRARLRASEARADAALARYEQTVLRALEETENGLVGFGRQRARLVSLRESARASARAAELARLRFNEGVADFLALLDAERTLLEAEDRVAQAETETYTALVAVYKALGGGWDACAPECASLARSAATSGDASSDR
ncbi:RND transporter [Sulfurifustis variabilis]|uniref:RND transporter n=1 Tax=Sulfurifustis variabilis TaxID=1675686 RepID=A0A1B4VD69_9GAMM|nr:efflux transporter outer membrane subunit [Sulfurifustis variabilis]BAU50321.1 RND transporter [Sulfurifustis variabilis]